ncbi:MAG: hypothetical protein AB1938_03920 [Myxococcota bacterium]
MLSLLLTALLAAPLDTSKVAVTRTVAARPVAPDAAVQLPPLADEPLTDEARADLEVLRLRFFSLAAAEGLPGFEPRAEVAAVPKFPGEGVFGVARTVKGQRTTWTFTAERLVHERQGPGCCPPCPCSPPPGSCAPCARCEDKGDCRFTTVGTQVVVTFTVVGRKLTAQHTLVQAVSGSVQVGAPIPTLSVERVEPASSLFAKTVKGRAAMLMACARKASKVEGGRATLEIEQDVDGRVTEVRVVQSSLGSGVDACLTRSLKSLRTTALEQPLTSRVVLRCE